jgi:hypothetical protein
MVCFRVDLHGFFLWQIILPKNIFHFRWKSLEVFDTELKGDDITVRGVRRPPFLDLHGHNRCSGWHAHRARGGNPSRA